MNDKTASSTQWIELSTSQLLLVSGPDAKKFLQGQVTCDMRELDENVTRLGAQCNPKGRVLLTFRALQLNAETIALRIPTSIRDKALESLGKYIVFSKATLIDAQEEFDLFEIHGEQARSVLANMFPELPEANDEFSENNGSFIIRINQNRYECWINSSQRDETIRQFNNVASAGNINEWLLHDIESGLGSVFPETIETFTPQELNYQLVGGVNFRKGCYTGQEIVARLHYRGKLKRHMYRFSLNSATLPVPGEKISNLQTNQIAGNVVMAAWKTQEEAEILASVLDENLSDLSLTQNQQKLKLLSLPYAIPTSNEN